MSKRTHPKTTQVEEAQIVEERPKSSDMAAPVRPPVRERAPTQVYQRPALSRESVSGGPPVAERGPSPKATAGAAHRQFVTLCPLPLVQLDTLGNVLWANEPFCELLREPREAVVGRRVDETRLGVIYPGVLEDLLTAARQKAPPTVKQVARFEERDGRAVTWLCWLAPETNAFDEVLRFFGYLHPLGDQP